MNKYEFQFREWLTENKPNLTIIGDYNGSNVKTSFHCNIHDCTGEYLPAFVKRGNNACVGCRKDEKSAIRKVYNESLSDEQKTSLSEKVSNSLKTSERNKANNANRIKEAGEKFVAWLSENKPNLTIAEEYIGAVKKIDIHCSIHNLTSKQRPNDIMNGRCGCKQCGIEQRNAIR